MTDIDGIQRNILGYIDFFTGAHIEHFGIRFVRPANEVEVILLIVVFRNGIFAGRYSLFCFTAAVLVGYLAEWQSRKRKHDRNIIAADNSGRRAGVYPVVFISGGCLYVFDLVGRADWQFLIKIGGIGCVQCAVDIDICRAIPVNVAGSLSVQKTVQVKVKTGCGTWCCTTCPCMYSRKSGVSARQCYVCSVGRTGIPNVNGSGSKGLRLINCHPVTVSVYSDYHVESLLYPGDNLIVIGG